MFSIKNLAQDDIQDMLQVASPDEVYSFVASHLKSSPETRTLKLQLIAKQIKAITQHTPLLSI